MGNDLIAVRRAAELLGVTDRMVRAMIAAGQLAGQRQGRRWLVTLRSVSALADERGQPLADDVREAVSKGKLPLPPPPDVSKITKRKTEAASTPCPS